jgi:aerotaxis receptor
MKDMDPGQLREGAFREFNLSHYDGTKRRVLVLDEEVAFPDGKLIVSRTDREGIITHANEAFVFMSGFSEAELIGTPHHILRHPDMPAAAFKDLWETVERGAKWHGYVKNLRKDGAYYWVYASVMTNLRGGAVVGYTSVRRRPSRARVDACTDLYARMRAEEAPR